MTDDSHDLVRSAAPREQVGAYLASLLDDEAWNHSTVTTLTGGKSNLTFLVSSAAGEVVLRRPPLSNRAPGAHDMSRECAVLQALQATPVPVPRVLGFHSDDSLLGVPFYVMEKIDGRVLDGPLPPDLACRPGDQRVIGEGLADVLGDLHAVDPSTVGLNTFGRPDGYLDRQLRTWTGQWERLRGDAEGGDSAALTSLASELTRQVPQQRDGCIVHGDYRLGNVMVHQHRAGRIAAVLDWELATLGDPLTDLSVAAMFWRESDESLDLPAAIPTTTAGEGFLTRAELVERYVLRTGRDVDRLPWYVALASFKYAVICADVAARGRAGAMIGGGFVEYEDDVEPFAALGHHALAGRFL